MEIGQHVIVYDEQSSKLFEGAITERSTNGTTIYVQYQSYRKFTHAGKQGEALIFTTKGAFRYSAKIGIIYNDSVELTLSNPAPLVDGRTSPRYAVDIDFSVDHIYLRDKQITIPAPICIRIKNISSKGMMFIAKPLFNVHTKISYSFWASENTAMHTAAEIIRMHNLGNGLVEYGCQFAEMIEM